MKREIGGLVIGYGVSKVVVLAIFGEHDDMQILEATALESLGYQVDPITKQLKPVKLLMVQAQRSSAHAQM